ncbi:hypothetical protein F2P81_022649 [Scophthalmus maximus]|uniref:Uncharacterized protein n=1 Tax=Scophthalmus maximus TaxID=52904 RepID=A0A6A4S0V9_SCOMX|nr:hypothetical protein F2P81_022649 [Scophthalmus maximus]
MATGKKNDHEKGDKHESSWCSDIKREILSVDNHHSQYKYVHFGVPQSSILGPQLFYFGARLGHERTRISRSVKSPVVFADYIRRVALLDVESIFWVYSWSKQRRVELYRIPHAAGNWVVLPPQATPLSSRYLF